MKEVVFYIIQAGLAGSVFFLAAVLLRAPLRGIFTKRFLVCLWLGVLIAFLAGPGLFLPTGIYQYLHVPALQNQTAVLQSYYTERQLVASADPLPDALESDSARTSCWWSPSVSSLWLAGFACAGTAIAVLYLRAVRKFSTAMPLKDHPTIAAWRRNHPGNTVILASDQTGVPLALGVFRQRIILPRSLDLDDTNLVNAILEHEYLHGRLGHNALKLLFTLCLAVHWFNPFAWVFWMLATHDLELACDEAVLRRIGVERRGDYARALVCVAESSTAPMPMLSAFNARNLKERVVEIMSYKTPHPGLRAAELAVAAMAFAFFGAAGNMGRAALHEHVAGHHDFNAGRVNPKQQAISLTGGGQFLKYECRGIGGNDFLILDIAKDDKLHQVIVEPATRQVAAHAVGDLPEIYRNIDDRKLINTDAAEAIAMREMGGGDVVGMELDYNIKTDAYQYDIEMLVGGREYEVEIDAATGHVEAVELDENHGF